MSLKQFHIVFIVIAVMLSSGFAVWAFTRYQPVVLMGVVSVVAAVALVIYGVWFFKKLKN